jgi:hypothetical protein
VVRRVRRARGLLSARGGRAHARARARVPAPLALAAGAKLFVFFFFFFFLYLRVILLLGSYLAMQETLAGLSQRLEFGRGELVCRAQDLSCVGFLYIVLEGVCEQTCDGEALYLAKVTRITLN